MRIFVALDLPEPLIDALGRLQSRLPGGRLVPPDALHLTLAFLSELTDAEVEAAHDALSGLAAPAIDLRLGDPAIFGGRWGQALGLAAAPDPALLQLQSRILSRLHGAGLTPERRRFRPHVTLVRQRAGTDAGKTIAALAGQHPGPARCVSFGLYASHLSPDGAWYDALATYPLTPPPPLNTPS